MKEHVVLDSWAVMVWLGAEQPAASEVHTLLERADANEINLSLCRINLGEVYYGVARRRGFGVADHVRTSLEASAVELVGVDDELIWQAAGLKARHSLSYADAFAAALALRKDAPLVTGDAEFEPLVKARGLKLRWLTRAR
jgi:predicted nucleic acid-binding protein